MLAQRDDRPGSRRVTGGTLRGAARLGRPDRRRGRAAADPAGLAGDCVRRRALTAARGWAWPATPLSTGWPCSRCASWSTLSPVTIALSSEPLTESWFRSRRFHNGCRPGSASCSTSTSRGRSTGGTSRRACSSTCDQVSRETRRSLEKVRDLVPAGVPGLEDVLPPLAEEAALVPGLLPCSAELGEPRLVLAGRGSSSWSRMLFGLCWPVTCLSLLGIGQLLLRWRSVVSGGGWPESVSGSRCGCGRRTPRAWCCCCGSRCGG